MVDGGGRGHLHWGVGNVWGGYVGNLRCHILYCGYLRVDVSVLFTVLPGDGPMRAETCCKS